MSSSTTLDLHFARSASLGSEYENAGSRQQSFWDSLNQGYFFKIIMGASFTNIGKITSLTSAYSQAGVDCIDIAADPKVVEAVSQALAVHNENRPVVMVSLPLDPDPHFRKIELDDPACIRCSLCVPVCPANALTLPDNSLEVSQTLCYGCGRCVPVCPTEALSLLPFQVEDDIETVLSNPCVEAVEIHSHHVDPYMLEAFWERWEKGLRGKIISLCFRPGNFSPEQIQSFCRLAVERSDQPILIQIDGAPMSGNAEPEASRPALEAARLALQILRADDALKDIPITISGGINLHTAAIRRHPDYRFVRGVGMGTVARQHIGDLTGPDAVLAATRVVSAFKPGSLMQDAICT